MNIIVASRRSNMGAFMRLSPLLIGVVIMLAAGGAWARSAPKSFAALAQRLLPAVVNISTTQVVKRGDSLQIPQLPPGSPFEEFFKEFFDRQQHPENRPRRRTTSLGSGFIIDPKGLVVTNNHVIAEADEITVITHDNKRLKATIVGRDTKTDLALLRVETDVPLKAVSFGDSDKARVGDWVLAIGNPFGLGGSVTAGIISARARNINAGPYDDFFQTDASINRGNSGGPLFNMDGEVIGINAAIYSPSGGSVGIGFSIAANLAQPLIEQLQKYGKARRGWLGVRIQTVTEELAESLGLNKARGALVADLTQGGPAEKSHLQVGDVILRFDGRSIDEMRELPRAVAETDVGKRVAVVIWRKGSEHTLMVRLGEFPEEEKVATATPDTKQNMAATVDVEMLGLTLSELNDELRERFKLGKDDQGVVVTEVKPDSPAAEKGVRPGDIVRRIGSDQQAVTSPAQVIGKLNAARESKLKTILFLFERGGSSRFVALSLKHDAG